MLEISISHGLFWGVMLKTGLLYAFKHFSPQLIYNSSYFGTLRFNGQMMGWRVVYIHAPIWHQFAEFIRDIDQLYTGNI